MNLPWLERGKVRENQKITCVYPPHTSVFIPPKHTREFQSPLNNNYSIKNKNEEKDNHIFLWEPEKFKMSLGTAELKHLGLLVSLGINWVILIT